MKNIAAAGPLAPSSLSFVVQFARDGDGGAGTGPRGWFEHVISGRCFRFSSLAELMELMNQALGLPTQEAKAIDG